MIDPQERGTALSGHSPWGNGGDGDRATRRAGGGPRALLVLAAVGFAAAAIATIVSSCTVVAPSLLLATPQTSDLARLRRDAVDLRGLLMRGGGKAAAATIIRLPRVRPEARVVGVPERDAVLGRRKAGSGDSMRRERGGEDGGSEAGVWRGGAHAGRRIKGGLGLGLVGGARSTIRAARDVALSEEDRMARERGIEEALKWKLKVLKATSAVLQGETGEGARVSSSLAASGPGGAVSWVRGSQMLVRAQEGGTGFSAGPSSLIVETKGRGRGRFR